MPQTSSDRLCAKKRRPRAIPALLVASSVVLASALVAGPRSAADQGTSTRGEEQDFSRADGSAAMVKPEAVELGSLAAFRVAEDLYCGPQPRTADDFAALKAAGVRAVIGLDGVVPNGKLAQQAGLRVVHVPVGFSDAEEHVPTLLAVMQRVPGPWYMHCRYGRPRTPAMVAMVAQVRYGWSKTQVADWLKQAGVDDGYQGLAASLAAFRPPSGDAVAQAKIPGAQTKTTPLVHSMAALLDDWEPLRQAAASEFKEATPETLNRLAKHAGAVETYLRRLAQEETVADWGADFVGEMAESAKATGALAAALRTAAESGNLETLPPAMKAAGSRCGACHSTYRN